MKHRLMYLAVFVMVVTSSQDLSSKDTHSPKAETVTTKQKVLSVDVIITQAKKYWGKQVSVSGTVADVDRDKSKFILKSNRSCNACEASCTSYALPVQCDNMELPKKGAKVNITGKISRIDGKFRFVLTAIRYIK